MSAIPLLSGVVATESADFALSYPTNLEGVGMENGISAGYLRSAAGAKTLGAGGPGVDRGGVVWNGIQYRVMGTKLVTVSSAGVVAEVGDVGGTGPVTLVYGYGRMAIRSGTNLYFWDGVTLGQVTDPDLGPCIDVIWFKGQFFSTDGTYIVALQIADPFSVDPNKYGSAESDPDGVTGLIRLRNEAYATGGNTIEMFVYRGGEGFPLQVSEGSIIPVGCVGPQAKCLYSQSFAFTGSSLNEGLGVWIAGGGQAVKISTRAIDDFLAAEPNPSGIQMESRASRDEERLFIHLSDKTLVYLKVASQQAKASVWYVAKSGIGMNKPYRPRNAVLFGSQWIVGDTESSNLGVLDDATAEHFEETVGWRFDTQLIYNKAKGGIAHTLELIGLPGRAPSGKNPQAYLSFTRDGETWSIERANTIGLRGQRGLRMSFRPHFRFRNYMGIRFRGDSSGLAGFAALEAEIEALSA